MGGRAASAQTQQGIQSVTDNYDLLGEILVRAGAWNPGDVAVPGQRPPRICAWSVCKAWRDCLRGPPGQPPTHLARLLSAVHGPEQALFKAVRCFSKAVEPCALVKLLLKEARADCQQGHALVIAAFYGNPAVARLLLEWPEHAPRADCQDGRALVLAATEGHEAMVQLLLGWTEHAPRADSQQGEALVGAAQNGHSATARLLLECKEHAPRADCQQGQALVAS